MYIHLNPSSNTSQVEIKINLLNTSEREVLSYLVSISNTAGSLTIKPSQSVIAKGTGYCRDTVNKAIQKLCRWELLSYVSGQKDYTVSTYTLNSEIQTNYLMRKRLACIISAFLWFSPLLLSFNYKLKLPTSAHIKKDRYIKCAYSHKVNFDYKDKKKMKSKKEDILNKFDEALNLNAIGRKKLEIFHEEVLEKAYRRIIDPSKGREVRNPMAWLMTFCKEESKNLRKYVDWNALYALKDSMSPEEYADEIRPTAQNAIKNRESAKSEKWSGYKAQDKGWLLERAYADLKRYEYLYSVSHNEALIEKLAQLQTRIADLETTADAPERLSAVQMANELHTFMDSKHLNKMSSLTGMKTATQLRNSFMAKRLNQGYYLDDEEAATPAALEYIKNIELYLQDDGACPSIDHQMKKD